MAAAGEAVRGLVTGPTQLARLLHAGPHASYYEATQSRAFALLGPHAVRVPIGVLLDAPGSEPCPPSPASVQIGDGAVCVDGNRHPILRWWATRVPDHDQLELSTDLCERNFDLITSERLGRGEGLTPEGDDELAGMLVALHAYGDRAAAARLASAVLTRLDAHPNATTAVSAALLRAACDGHAVPQLARFLAEGCATGTAAHRDLLAVGHTSGAALARGALQIHAHHTHLKEAALV